MAHLKDPQYVKVLDGRPLVYAFQCNASKKFFDGVSAAAVAAGLPKPYFVNMGNTPHLSADAESSYTGKAGGWVAKAGTQVIPGVSSGWDRRPRVQNPVPWEGGTPQAVTGGPNKDTLAPKEIAARVKAALDWNKAHPEAGKANAVIIYAWNEFDEGGWICPTLSEGTARLDAIRAVLKASATAQAALEERAGRNGGAKRKPKSAAKKKPARAGKVKGRKKSKR